MTMSIEDLQKVPSSTLVRELERRGWDLAWWHGTDHPHHGNLTLESVDIVLRKDTPSGSSSSLAALRVIDKGEKTS